MIRDWNSTSQFQTFLLLVLGLFIALRLIYWFGAFPNPDEAYYWLWGKHPDLSYFDHPPLQAWLQGLAYDLFGDTLFGLRLFNLLTSLGLAGLFYLYLKPLLAERATSALLLTLALVLASPVMFGFLATAWPDHIMLFTSSMAVLLFLRFFDGYLRDGKGRSTILFHAAAWLGLAAISKYNSVFVALGLLLTLASNRRLRGLLRDWRLYAAAVVTLAVMGPLLLWNHQHAMASFDYQLMQRTVIGRDSSFSLFDGFVYLLTLVFTLSPFIVWMLYRAYRERGPITSSLADHAHYWQLPLWTFVASSTIFILFSFFDPMLYYWNIVAYPFLFPLLAAFLLLQGRHRFAVHGHLLYGFVFATAMVVHTAFVPLSAYIDGKGDQDSRMLYGWKEVGRDVKQRLAKLGDRGVLIATDYRKASALSFITGSKDVLCVSGRRDEFDYWQQGKAYDGEVALILYDDWHPINHQLKAMFRSIKTVKTIEIRRHGVHIKRYYLAIGRGAIRRTIPP